MNFRAFTKIIQSINYHLLRGFGIFYWMFLSLLASRFNFASSVLRDVTNLDFTSTGRTSGVAVSDLDKDGTFEVIVSLLDGPNMIVKYDKVRNIYYDVSTLYSKYNVTRDEAGRTISVCTCDVDGDGIEEIYLHNHNDVYPVTNTGSMVPDKLLKVIDGVYIDLFALNDDNRGVAPKYGGYSVACIDRTGNGIYDVIVSTFTKEGRGTYKVLSTQQKKKEEPKQSSSHVLTDISKAIGLLMERDGRGILVGPLINNDYRSNIFITNDNSYYVGSKVFRHDGRNVFLENRDDGTFQDIAEELGVDDRNNNGRSSGMIDINGDGKLDLTFSNWLGPTRVFQQEDRSGTILLQEKEGLSFSYSSPSEILLTADFDNDGQIDVLKSGANGNIKFPTYNEIFTIIAKKNSTETEVEKTKLDVDEKFERLRMRGIAAADLDGDGILELFISHDDYRGKTFSIFKNVVNSFNWIRFMPLTKHGSHARGSFVTLTLEGEDERRFVIGGDCSYMCQSEPVAHFGLGHKMVKQVEVIWPDGHKFRKYLFKQDIRKTLQITYSGNVTYLGIKKSPGAIVSKASEFQTSFYVHIWTLSLCFILKLCLICDPIWL